MELSFILAELLAALREPGCALCRLHANRERRYISTLLAEQTNEARTLRAFSDSHGWCVPHARRLAQTNVEDWGDIRKTAILYEAAWAGVRSALSMYGQDDLNESAQTRSVTEETPKHPEAAVRSVPVAWHRRGQPAPVTEPSARQRFVEETEARPCPLCQSMAEYDTLVLRVVAPALRHDRLRKAWQSADPVCLPHLNALIEQLSDEADEGWLVSDACGKVEVLAQGLEAYLSMGYADGQVQAHREAEHAVLRLMAWFTGDAQTGTGTRDTLGRDEL